ncbi:hypothetical protein F4703DRAFT_1838847 [Phycomyces blakesleeanus]
MSSSLEETKAMIQQVEELIALAPTDDSLLTMLADLYDVLEKAMAEQLPEEKEEEEEEEKEKDAFPCGTQCVISFTLDDRQYLLPALVLERLALSNEAKVLILTPITADTVACTNHIVKHACKTPCPNQRSHGYLVPVENLLPYDILGISDIENYRPSKRVWCKVDKTTAVWQVGRIVGQDGSTDNQWRVQCASDMSTLHTLGIESIMPYKIHDTKNDTTDNDTTTSDNDDNEHYVDGQNDPEHESEHESDHELERVDLEEFGGWQAHTNGFASKMMKKMGYVSGKGLGLHGQGRIDPVEAFMPNVKKRSIPGQDRPGLGSNSEPPKKPKRPQSRLVDTSVFAFMNKTLSKPKEEEEEEEEANSNDKNKDKKQDREGANKGSRKPVAAITLNPKETQRQLHALQTEIAQTSETLARAHESVRRNKGTPMESQFVAKVDRVAKALAGLQKQADRLQGTLKRTKEREKMVSF